MSASLTRLLRKNEASFWIIGLPAQGQMQGIKVSSIAERNRITDHMMQELRTRQCR